jgi:DNA-binding PadR family transcriptional regulator
MIFCLSSLGLSMASIMVDIMKNTLAMKFLVVVGEMNIELVGVIKFILLELLSEHPSHGYDLIKEMETRHGGFRRLSPGSVYPTLQLLEEGGYLKSAQEGGKRIYTITDEGRQLLAERTQQDTPDSPWDTFKSFVTGKPQEFIELRNAATELAAVVVQVARSGNMERINQVRELLEQVKREIYAILAQK